MKYEYASAYMGAVFVDRGSTHPWDVFLVEDDALLASTLTEALSAGDFKVVGQARTLSAAARWLEHHPVPDMALLDVGLPGGTVFPIVERLLGQGVIVVFTTGADPIAIPVAYRSLPCLQKPFGVKELIVLLAALRAGASNLNYLKPEPPPKP